MCHSTWLWERKVPYLSSHIYELEPTYAATRSQLGLISNIAGYLHREGALV